jgi:hypothetical protein
LVQAGNEYPEGTEGLATRLYTNNGDGKFKPMPMLSPPMHINVSCLRIRELKNGPTLLFAGGRSVTKGYGLNPANYVMMIISEKWTDITPDFIKRIGMVTDARWTDYNKDGFIDLIIVGEWMPITFIKNNGKTLELDFQLEHSNGWWNSIYETDLNQDGYPDFIVGNWGLNSRFHATGSSPMNLYVNDYDKNQSPDPIICIYNPADGKTYPYNTRADILTQMPFLKKENLKYKDYASKTYEQLFTPEQRKNDIIKKVDNLESSFLINEHGTSFTLKALPLEAQVAPVFSSIMLDSTTYLLAGNFFKSKPEIGRMDASYGTLLQFDKKQNNFNALPNRENAMYIEGEIKDMRRIQIKGKPYIILSRNNAPLQLMRIKED